MTKRNILINTTVFAVGAAIGSAATWFVVKKKYEKISQEVDSVKEVFAKIDEVHNWPYKSAQEEYKIEGTIEEESVKIVEECNNIMAGPTGSSPYTNYSDNETKGGSEEMGLIDKPYVISPEDYDDIQDYNKVTLTYYADKILADDYDNVIEDVENTVGRASLETFGKYEEDTVFVRNDAKCTDYEITLDTRTFSDVINDISEYDI